MNSDAYGLQLARMYVCVCVCMHWVVCWVEIVGHISAAAIEVKDDVAMIGALKAENAAQSLRD